MTFVPINPQDNPGDDQEASNTIEEAQELPPVDQSTPAEQSSPVFELPPEAQGEVNGGPLGCCLGVTIGLLLSLVVAVLSRFYADPLAQVLHGNLSIVIRLVMIVLAIAGAIIFGYIGWKIGRRVYREYELTPRQKQKLERLQQRQLQRLRSRR